MKVFEIVKRSQQLFQLVIWPGWFPDIRPSELRLSANAYWLQPIWHLPIKTSAYQCHYLYLWLLPITYIGPSDKCLSDFSCHWPKCCIGSLDILKDISYVRASQKPSFCPLGNWMSSHKECKKGLQGSVNSRLQRWEPPFSPPVPTCDMHWPNQHFPTDIEYVGNAIFSKIKVLTSPKCLIKISRRPRIYILWPPY